MLVRVGTVAVIWPAELGGWIVGQTWFPATTDDDASIVDAMTSLTTTAFGAVSLRVGATFVAVASAVAGARRAGWVVCAPSAGPSEAWRN